MSESGTQSPDEVANGANQLILLGDVEGALQLLKAYLIGDPFEAKVTSLVESLLLSPDQGRGLVRFYNDLQKSQPDDWRFLVCLARACAKTGKESLAVVHLQKVLRKNGEFPEVWMELATCYMRLQKPELALRALNSLIDLQSNYAPAHVSRLRYLVETGDLEEAAAASIFSLGIKDLPPSVQEWLDLVNLQLEQGLKPDPDLLQDLSEDNHAQRAARSQTSLLSERERTQQLLIFTTMLAIMVKGGLSFSRIFGILASQKIGRIHSIITSLEEAVIRDGEPLSKALARHPEYFSDQYVALIEIGESTNLSRNLDRLCEQLRGDFLKDSPPEESAPALILACRILVDVLEAGGSEAKALNWAARACVDETVKQGLTDVERQIQSGSRLVECKFPPCFTPIFGGLIAAHEAVGTTPNAFKDLARLLGQ